MSKENNYRDPCHNVVSPEWFLFQVNRFREHYAGFIALCHLFGSQWHKFGDEITENICLQAGYDEIVTIISLCKYTQVLDYNETK